MGLRQFTLKNMHLVEGGLVGVVFDEHMARIAKDIEDRPGDKTARKLTVTISVEPRIRGKDCDEGAVQVAMKSSIPDHKTQTISVGLRKNGILTFNPDSEDNVNQGTLLDDEED